MTMFSVQHSNVYNRVQYDYETTRFYSLSTADSESEIVTTIRVPRVWRTDTVDMEVNTISSNGTPVTVHAAITRSEAAKFLAAARTFR